MGTYVLVRSDNKFHRERIRMDALRDNELSASHFASVEKLHRAKEKS